MNWNHKLDKMPKEVLNIWYELEQAGYPTFLVGGAVRDFLLDIEPNDFDLATLATPDEIKIVIEEHLPAARMNFVGASFGVMIVNGIEVATFRKDQYSGSGSDKDVKIEYCDSIDEDLARRDFRFNAMAIDSFGELIDPFNGEEDLATGVINFVGDPNERINEDYNRIIRACRFIAKLGFASSHDTARAIYKNREKVLEIAPERIRLEMIKAMDCEHPSIFFGCLEFLGILELLLPELSDCKDHTGGKHHPESVWEHNMLVGDALPKEDPILRLAGFFHDIGKPQAWKEAPGKFISHHKIGKRILEMRLAELKFSNEETRKICGLVDSHMYFISGLSPKAHRKLLRNLGAYTVDWRDLVRLRIADHKGNIAKSPKSISEIKEIVRSFTQVEEVPRDTKSLVVSGGQLMLEFELVPGPIIGFLQNALLEYVIDSGVEDEDCLLVHSHKLLQSLNEV